MSDEQSTELPGWLQSLPSPIEQGRQEFDWIMEYGTPFQKETLLCVIKSMSRLTPEAGDDVARRFCAVLPGRVADV